MKAFLILLAGGIAGVLIMNYVQHDTVKWTKPYLITLVDVTEADIKQCQKDPNCLDIMSIKELCTVDELKEKREL